MPDQTYMVFQHFPCGLHMTVLENIIEAPVHVLKKNKQEAKDRGMALLEKSVLLTGIIIFQPSFPAASNSGPPLPRHWQWIPRSFLFDEPHPPLDPGL